MKEAARQSFGITPGFPTEAIQSPTTKLGLELPSISKRAAAMGTEHLVTVSNMPTDRGHIAHMHHTRLLYAYHHWPSEALEHHKVRLPTVKVHRYMANIGLELDQLPRPTTTKKLRTPFVTSPPLSTKHEHPNVFKLYNHCIPQSTIKHYENMPTDQLPHASS